MASIEEELAKIGFARCRRNDCDWRTVRLERQASAVPSRRAAEEPGCSPELLRWRARLRRRSRPSPYRISRA